MAKNLATGEGAGTVTEQAQAIRELEVTKLQALADEQNKGRGKAKGTRIRVGQTRGKSPKVISWEAFDTDQPETCPKDLDEFMTLTKVSDEKVITSYLIDGFNSAAYSAASDVLAEYCEPNWPDQLVKQFKLTIANYSAATGSSLEDSVALLKPGIVKAFEARLLAASAA